MNINELEKSSVDLGVVRLTIEKELVKKGIENAMLSNKELLLMQVVAHMLTEHETFYPLQIAQVVGINPGMATTPLRKFERVYKLLESHLDPNSSGPGRPRIVYSETNFGHQLFGLFIPEEG